MKKTLLLLFAIFMLIGLMSLSASAASDADLSYTVANGEVTITDCADSASGELVIPEAIEGYPVTKIGENAFGFCNFLTKITLPDGVTSIDSYAFQKCGELTEITIPDSVTKIGVSTFSGCDALKKVTLPNGITVINGKMFYRCTGLTEIIIPDSVTVIGSSAFYGCTALTDITMGDGITEIQTSAFFESGYFNDSNNREDGVVYYGAYLLGTVSNEVPATYTIKEGTRVVAGGAFSWCSNLTEIIIPDSVLSIPGDMLSYCGNLTKVTIPDGVTKIGGYGFTFCTALTEIVIPDSVTTIENSAFYGCEALTTVYFEGSQEQWGAIAISEENEPLTDAIHIIISEEEIPATCVGAGREAGKYCIKCEAFEKGGAVIPATGDHSGGEATCIAPAVCGVCDQAYGEVDADNHKTIEVRGATDASYDAPGYTGDTYCTDCGTLVEAGKEIPQLVKPAEPDDTTGEKDIFHWLIELIKTIVEFLTNVFDI